MWFNLSSCALQTTDDIIFMAKLTNTITGKKAHMGFTYVSDH